MNNTAASLYWQSRALDQNISQCIDVLKQKPEAYIRVVKMHRLFFPKSRKSLLLHHHYFTRNNE